MPMPLRKMVESTSGKKIFRGAIYGLSTWALPISLSLVVTPILVRTLGSLEYGIYALVLGFIAYSFNFNIGRAATRYIAEYRSTGREDEIGSIVTATLLINIIVGLIGLSSIFLTSDWLVKDIFRIGYDHQSISIYSLKLAGLIIFILILGQIFTSVVQGFQRFDIYARLQNFNSFAGLTGNLVLALNGYGLTALLTWNLIVSILSCIFSAIAALRLLKGLTIVNFSSSAIKLVIRHSSGVVGYQIAANGLLLFERGWITSHFGSSDLTYYVVPMSLSILLNGFVISLTMSLFPTTSEIGHERERLLDIYLITNKIVCTLIVFPVVFLIVWSNVIMSVWLGIDFAAHSAQFLQLHTLTFGFISIYVVSFQVAEGVGKANFNFITMFAAFLLTILLVIVVSPLYGLKGIAEVRSIVFFLVFLSYIFLERSLFGTIQLKFWGKTLFHLVIAAGFATSVGYLIGSQLDPSWFILGLVGAIALILYATILWMTGFVTNKEKKTIFRAFSKAR